MKIESFQYFYPEKPRLLTINQPLFDWLSKDKNWVAEAKLNGSRLQLHFLNGHWEFWGRHGEPLAYKPTDNLLKALKKLGLKGYWLFDGELRHNKTKGIQNRICLYDMIIQEGKLLLGMPFKERRKILQSLILEEYPTDNMDKIDGQFVKQLITIPKQYPFGFKSVFGHLTKEDEIEGLVIKNLEGKLNLGRKAGTNSGWMWKVRKPNGSYHF